MPEADIDDGAAARHARLLAALLVVTGDVGSAQAAAGAAIGQAALVRSRPPDDDAGLVDLLRFALADLDRRRRPSWRGPARPQPRPDDVPPGWDAAQWARICALSASSRRSLALRVVAALSAAEADEVTGTRRALSSVSPGPDGAIALELLDSPLPLPDEHAAIASLADRLLVEPPDVEQARAAARASRTRRRVRTGVATAAVLIVVGVGLAVVERSVGHPGGDPVADLARAGIGAATTVPVTTDGAALTLHPDRGLRDGQLVEVRLRGVPARTLVTLLTCTRPPLGLADLGATCDAERVRQETLQGGGALFRVNRFIRLASGQVVDCATVSSPCVVVAEISSIDPSSLTVQLGRGPSAPLELARPGAPGQPRILMERHGTLTDGKPVRVRGVRFAPDEQIHLALCGSRDPTQLSCDAERDIDLFADAEGRFSVPLRLYRDILTAGWTPCTRAGPGGTTSGCVLVATGSTSGSATLPLTFGDAATATGAGIRPRIAILTPGPYRLGQVVRLRGTGFQPGGDVRVGTCPAPIGPALTDCTYPGGTADRAFIEPRRDGSFDLPQFPLPTDPRCATTPGACVIGGHQTSPVDFTTPLAFTR